MFGTASNIKLVNIEANGNDTGGLCSGGDGLIEIQHSKNVKVIGFNALLMRFAEKQGATVVVRGLRAMTDFEYEFQMTGMNRQLNPGIETVFLMAEVGLQPIASKMVKEIALFGGAIDRFVSPSVRDEVLARVNKIGRLGEY